jgi:hypothetical protein
VRPRRRLGRADLSGFSRSGKSTRPHDYMRDDAPRYSPGYLPGYSRVFTGGRLDVDVDPVDAAQNFDQGITAKGISPRACLVLIEAGIFWRDFLSNVLGHEGA